MFGLSEKVLKKPCSCCQTQTQSGKENLLMQKYCFPLMALSSTESGELKNLYNTHLPLPHTAHPPTKQFNEKFPKTFCIGLMMFVISAVSDYSRSFGFVEKKICTQGESVVISSAKEACLKDNILFDERIRNILLAHPDQMKWIRFVRKP